jgi:hypothetical protein
MVKLGEFHGKKVNFTIKGGENFHVQNIPFHGTVSRHFQVNFHRVLDQNPDKRIHGFCAFGSSSTISDDSQGHEIVTHYSTFSVTTTNLTRNEVLKARIQHATSQAQRNVMYVRNDHYTKATIHGDGNLSVTWTGCFPVFFYLYTNYLHQTLLVCHLRIQITTVLRVVNKMVIFGQLI